MLDKDKVLIVDDEPSVRFGVSRFFATQGLSGDTAASLEEARQLIHQHNYGVVLMDYRLGDTDGLEALQELTSMTGARFILLTGYRDDEVDERSRALGVDVVLEKPVPMDSLQNLVETMLAQRTTI